MSNLKGMIMERAGTTDKLRLKEGLNKNKWYKANKKAFEYLSSTHSTDFTGEKFFDAFDFAKERAGGKTAILGHIKGRFPLPEEYIKSFALRFAADAAVPAGFEINDISIVYRLKGIR